jgi:hypothetical protein
MNALVDRSTCKLELKGKHRFKNVNEAIEISEILNAPELPIMINPVCRLVILDKTTAIQHPEKRDLFFCSQACLTIVKASHETDANI